MRFASSPHPTGITLHGDIEMLAAISEAKSFQLPQAFVQTLSGFQRVTGPELAIDLFNPASGLVTL